MCKYINKISIYIYIFNIFIPYFLTNYPPVPNCSYGQLTTSTVPDIIIYIFIKASGQQIKDHNSCLDTLCTL